MARRSCHSRARHTPPGRKHAPSKQDERDRYRAGGPGHIGKPIFAGRSHIHAHIFMRPLYVQHRVHKLRAVVHHATKPEFCVFSILVWMEFGHQIAHVKAINMVPIELKLGGSTDLAILSRSRIVSAPRDAYSCPNRAGENYRL